MGGTKARGGELAATESGPNHPRSTPVTANESATEHLLEVARVARPFVSLAIDFLPDCEHDLLVESYGLERTGFRIRDRTALSLLQGQSRKSALARARVTFSQKLKAILESYTREIATAPDRLLELMASSIPTESPRENTPSDLRELRGIGGIRPDYDYKSLRYGKTQA